MDEMGLARAVLLTALGQALFIKLIGQAVLLGRDPAPDAAAACVVVARLVAITGGCVAAVLWAVHWADPEARRDPTSSPHERD
jgi:hypothetical protein